MPQPRFDAVPDALSRGALPTAFLNGGKSPEEFCTDLELQVRRLVSHCTASCETLLVASQTSPTEGWWCDMFVMSLCRGTTGSTCLSATSTLVRRSKCRTGPTPVSRSWALGCMALATASWAAPAGQRWTLLATLIKTMSMSPGHVVV